MTLPLYHICSGSIVMLPAAWPAATARGCIPTALWHNGIATLDIVRIGTRCRRDYGLDSSTQTEVEGYFAQCNNWGRWGK
jgi:hypothetical protein